MGTCPPRSIVSWLALTVLVLALPSGAAGQGLADPLVTVVVKLQDPPVARYSGGVAGLAATNPQVTGRSRVEPSHSDVRAYTRYLAGQHATFEAAAASAIPGARVIHSYRMVLGGVALAVPASQVGKVAALPGVVAVYPDALRQLDTTRSPTFIGAGTLWTRLGGQRSAGEGVIVGVLDTGIWPEHPSFSDPDPKGKAYAAPPGPGRACQFSGGAYPGPAFTCNNKLIGAHRFMAAYDACGACAHPADDFTSARDSNGHGTHTASTAAGNGNVATDIFDIARGVASGIAPRAHVVAYKVCGAGGCFNSDSAAAVQQAVLDDVDVINFSISGGESPYSDVVELAFRDAYAAGVFVAASAGNSGPAAGTVHHRGPWVTTVAASTEYRQFTSRLSVSSPAGNLVAVGASVTPGIKNLTPIVLATDAGDTWCLNPGPDTAFVGAIVVCRRGTNARAEKALNVYQRGAVGMVLYNEPGQEGLSTDLFIVPGVHISAEDGADLVTLLGASPGAMASLPAGTTSGDRGDVMAQFSSRGGSALSLGVAKPDITAPGVQILAGNTPASSVPYYVDGELFQAIAGTSMSSPHVAGAAVLLRAHRPGWTPGQIKSALMTTATRARLVKEDGSTPADAFDAGSGRIDLTRAHDPGLTFDVSVADYIAHAADLWTVNYPSLYLPAGAPDVVTVQRTPLSVLGASAVWDVVVSPPPDTVVTVAPQFVLPAGGTTPVSITVDKTAVPAGQVRFGHLELRTKDRKAYFPITVVGSP